MRYSLPSGMSSSEMLGEARAWGQKGGDREREGVGKSSHLCQRPLMDTSSKKSCSYANKVHMDVGAMRPHYACGQHPRRALSVVSRLASAYTQAAQQVALLPILPACRRLVGNTCLLVALLPRPCPSRRQHSVEHDPLNSCQAAAARASVSHVPPRW